eukprot:s9476_g3.t1
MKAVTKAPEEIHEMATVAAGDLLREWDPDKARQLIQELARAKFFSERKFGVFRHGGTIGWLTGIVEYPSLSKALNRLVLEACPEASFTSVMVSCNTPKVMHRDLNNDYNTLNYIVPLAKPDRGGDLWIELKEGDIVEGPIEQREVGDQRLYGQLRTLREGEGIEFGPRRYHEVCNWEGERIVLIAYTPDCLGKLSQDDLHALHDHMFPVPLSQLPEFHGDMKTERLPPRLRAARVPLDELQASGDQERERQGWSMYLDLQPGLVKITEDLLFESRPAVRKAEVGYTRNIEQVLCDLQGPLEVVYNVAPEEVMENLEAWRPAIVKEIGGIEVTSIIQSVWNTSEMTVLGPKNSVRFLGMELHREGETEEEITIYQQGYIQELVRAHGIKETQLDRVPITKELAQLPEEVGENSEDRVRLAQQITGEVLWVAQRTRPDLAYTTSMMASMCTRCPDQVVAIGLKALGYLQRTMGYGLKVTWTNKDLVMFCDAAYAPQSARSHGGWVVTYGGVPVVWRSGRQQMITLSTAEAELLSMIDGAVAMKGVESLLLDLGERVTEREIATDSMAALSISSGSSSWRTRHLRIKANWLQEQISYGLVRARHCPGEFQPADMLTKALSYARMTSLLALWGVRGGDPEPPPAVAIVQGKSRMMVALVCCLLILSVQASGETSANPGGAGVQVDRDLVGTFMLGLMLLGGLLLWEGVKWMGDMLYHEYIPGASKRKLKKLRKIQRATTEAIERELERLRGRLAELVLADQGPTVRQLRFVLWLWREKDMSGRHILRYYEVCDRTRISALISQWNSR